MIDLNICINISNIHLNPAMNQRVYEKKALRNEIYLLRKEVYKILDKKNNRKWGDLIEVEHLGEMISCILKKYNDVVIIEDDDPQYDESIFD